MLVMSILNTVRHFHFASIKWNLSAPYHKTLIPEDFAPVIHRILRYIQLPHGLAGYTIQRFR